MYNFILLLWFASLCPVSFITRRYTNAYTNWYARRDRETERKRERERERERERDESAGFDVIRMFFPSAISVATVINLHKFCLVFAAMSMHPTSIGGMECSIARFFLTCPSKDQRFPITVYLYNFTLQETKKERTTSHCFSLLFHPVYAIKKGLILYLR